MKANRIAAKRRASFGRADRLRKEERQKAEQARTEQRRKEERDKADRQRKAESLKAAEQRNAQARKRAEQRRLERQRENIKKAFARQVEDRRAETARADQRRQADVAKIAPPQHTVERVAKERDAEVHVARREQQQRGDQRDEHRRQTGRLRAEHDAQRHGARHREAAAIIDHARQIRNIDIAERRELEALDAQRRSLTGRVVGLVRGSGHFARQEQAIAERHESERWQKHRDHEARKDNAFWMEQAARLRRVADRVEMAKSHEAERHALVQAQERSRPERVKDHVRALDRLQQLSIERAKRHEAARTTERFGQAAGQVLRLKPNA